MADESKLRAHRSDSQIDAQRGASRPGKDPLAELARLIGQDDLFEQMKRDAARAERGGAGAPPSMREDFPASTLRPGETRDLDAAAGAELRAPPTTSRPTINRRPDRFDSAYPVRENAPAASLYQDTDRNSVADTRHLQQARSSYYAPESLAAAAQPEPEPYYAAPSAGQPASMYADPAFDPAYADDEPYADEPPPPPPRRRRGLMAVAAVLGIAAIGVVGAFAYRSFSGGESASQPPIIKASATPAKVPPAAPAKEAGPRTAFDRSEGGQGERVVSREEQPLEIKAARPAAPKLVGSGAPSGMMSMVGQAPVAGMTPPSPQGAAGPNEPKRVKTLAIRPDGTVIPETNSSRAAARVAHVAPAAPSPRPAANPSASQAPFAAAPQTEPSRAPTRTASIPPVAPAAGSHVVQVSSQRSEEDARASFRELQAKYPQVLGGRSPLIRRTDLGERGVFYRVQIGPFASPEAANELCGNLKSAGGQCIVQRN